jgi:hypothetical protein
MDLDGFKTHPSITVSDDRWNKYTLDFSKGTWFQFANAR